jgi:polysaccharide export outer membrane protein
MTMIGRTSAAGPLLTNAAFITLTFAVTAALGQSEARKNNPYAPSPPGNVKQVGSPAVKMDTSSQIPSLRKDGQAAETMLRNANYEAPPAAPSVFPPNPVSLAPTEIYKIGVGDVILIKLGNAAAGRGYYTVRPDGTIDFPLAGDDVKVEGATASETSRKLRSSIKLFDDPRVEVSVTEYASHSVMVKGKVKNPGEKNLRREAVPLFVIKAEALVDADANGVRIMKAGGGSKTYALGEAHTDNLLIDPGTSLEFTVEDFRPPAQYFIANGAGKSSERVMRSGLTLSEAAAAEAIDAKKATVHRQDKNGKYSSRDFDLAAIRSGKSSDLAIEAGDLIQIRN